MQSHSVYRPSGRVCQKWASVLQPRIEAESRKNHFAFFNTETAMMTSFEIICFPTDWEFPKTWHLTEYFLGLFSFPAARPSPLDLQLILARQSNIVFVPRGARYENHQLARTPGDRQLGSQLVASGCRMQCEQLIGTRPAKTVYERLKRKRLRQL